MVGEKTENYYKLLNGVKKMGLPGHGSHGKVTQARAKN
jgi:hypothetical protein